MASIKLDRESLMTLLGKNIGFEVIGHGNFNYVYSVNLNSVSVKANTMDNNFGIEYSIYLRFNSKYTYEAEYRKDIWFNKSTIESVDEAEELLNSAIEKVKEYRDTLQTFLSTIISHLEKGNIVVLLGSGTLVLDPEEHTIQYHLDLIAKSGMNPTVKINTVKPGETKHIVYWSGYYGESLYKELVPDAELNSALEKEEQCFYSGEPMGAYLYKTISNKRD